MAVEGVFVAVGKDLGAELPEGVTLIGVEGLLVAVGKELNCARVGVMLVKATGEAVTLLDALSKESTTRMPKMKQQKRLMDAIGNNLCVWKSWSTQSQSP